MTGYIAIIKGDFRYWVDGIYESVEILKTKHPTAWEILEVQVDELPKPLVTHYKKLPKEVK